MDTRATSLKHLLVGVVVISVIGALVQIVAVRRASAAPNGSITLHVQSARTVGGASTVHKGDPVTSYKWMINVDDTGDPGTLSNRGIDIACRRRPLEAAPTRTTRTPVNGQAPARHRDSRRLSREATRHSRSVHRSARHGAPSCSVPSTPS